MEEPGVPRVSSDPSLVSSIRHSSSRRSLIQAFENAEIEAPPPSPCRTPRSQWYSSFLMEDPRAKPPASLTRSMSNLPYVRFPLQQHNPPPVPPLPASPGIDMSRRTADTAAPRVVRSRAHLRPSPRSASLLTSPRPRSGSHTSESNSSGSPSPAASRPVSPSPLSPMLISSPRPQDSALATRPMPTSFQPINLQPIHSQETMDGMSDVYVQQLEFSASNLSLDRSLSAEGSQPELHRSISAETVMTDPRLTVSLGVTEQRRKREIAVGHARLSQSTSNLSDSHLDSYDEHYQSVLPRSRNSTQPDLWLVSPDTVGDLVNGKFSQLYQNCYIIDCRYPYEYKGGHVRGAINLSSKEAVQDFFMSLETKHNTVIVFYCEFSSQRGPGSYRHLRECDRKQNKTRYPSVWYPQTYVLEGGYKAFWEAHPHSCEPHSYITMLDERYKEELRQCQMHSTRMRSKSFSCIELPRTDTVPDSLLRCSASQQ